MNVIADQTGAIRDQIDASKAQLALAAFPELSFDEARWRGLAKHEHEQFLQQVDLIRKGLRALRIALAR